MGGAVAPSRKESAAERRRASARRRQANRARAELRAHPRVRARPVYPGQRIKTTIRCHGRRFYMTPYGRPRDGLSLEQRAKELENFVGYAIARAQLKYGFLFHGGIAMGNHPHYDTTDVHGNRPKYKNSIHSCLARGFNARLGRFDSMFSPGGSCDTETDSDEETLRDLAYNDVNPVEAGLVKWGRLWPGFSTYGWRFGKSRKFRRPSWFHDPDNPDNPEEIDLVRVRPPGIYPELSDEQLSDKLMEMCQELEREKQRQMKAEGSRFKGLKKLAKTKWHDAPTTSEDKFKVEPKVASSDRWRRIAAIQRNAEWEAHYARSREAHARGENPLFPYGTYLLRVRYNVRVAPRPP